MDVRTEHEAFGVHEHVPLAPGEAFRTVVAALAAADARALYGLAVQYRSARVAVLPSATRTASRSRSCARRSAPLLRHVRKW